MVAPNLLAAKPADDAIPAVKYNADMNEARKHDKYESLIYSCHALAPVRTAVAHPCDESSLVGAVEAVAAKIIIPILVGPEARIRALEEVSRREGQTQLLIETPYRNAALLDTLLAQLRPTTMLSVSAGLSLNQAWTRSARVSAWRQQATKLAADVPAVFAFLAER